MAANFGSVLDTPSCPPIENGTVSNAVSYRRRLRGVQVQSQWRRSIGRAGNANAPSLFSPATIKKKSAAYDEKRALPREMLKYVGEQLGLRLLRNGQR